MSNYSEREKRYVNQIPDETGQPELQGGGTPYYQPMIMPSEKADLYDKIRPEDIVESIKYLLMGYEFDKSRRGRSFD